MSDFLTRLKAESEELDCKLVKLTAFDKSKGFYGLSYDAQNDLTEQLYCMSNLSRILRTRIAKAEGFYSGYIATDNQTSIGCTVSGG